MAESTTSTLSHLITPLIQEVLYVSSERSIMRGLVRNFKVPANSGKVLQVPIYPTVTATAPGEASDLSSTTVTTTSQDITLVENGIMVELTDLSRATSETDVVRDLGRLLGEAIARKMDTDLTALFDGFSTEVGDGTAVTNAAAIFNAVSSLRENAVPNTDLACVVHPKIAYDIKAGLSATFANPNPGVGNEALRSGFVGTIAGVPVYETSNMSNTGNAGEYKGAVFHKDALGLAILNDLKIEIQRDASKRSQEIVATAVYGVKELQDTYGVELHGQSSIQS